MRPTETIETGANLEEHPTSAGIREEARRADIAAEERLSHYRSRFGLRQMFSEQNQLLLSTVGKSDRLLEIGTGAGTFLLDAIRTPDIGRVCGVDVSLESARLALESSNRRAWIVLAPAELLPFPDACFDAVVARGVLHHLTDVAAGVGEAQRILRAGGRLVILEGNPASRYRRVLLGLADLLGIPHENTQYRHLWPSEISQLLSTFRSARATAVNGFFAPLAYVGFGGRLAWKFMTAIKFRMTRLWPTGFAWWLLWTTEK